MDHHTALKLVPVAIGMQLKTSGCTEFGPLNWKESDCFSPKCVFSVMDPHTALKLVPVAVDKPGTSGCAEFGSLNMKESDVLA